MFFLVTVFSSFISGFTITIISGFLLVSSSVFANADTVSESVDASVNVSMACSMSGIGMNSHNAEIANGQYNSNIGETTLKAYCNDNEGFSIYAIGYTDDTEGKNVLTDAQLGNTHDIQTGTALSGNSQWAMRLFAPTSPTPTYPVSIQNSFDSFHAVPNDYALVAKRMAGTDAGENAEGSTLKTTYQAYISNTQKAGTYNGKVKYVMVHPNTAPIPVSDNQIGVVYDGNGQTFSGGAATNRVVYETACAPDYYIGTVPAISKTPNINNDGVATSGYQYNYTQKDPVSFAGATRLKVKVDYGVESNYDYVYVFEGNYTGTVTDNMEAGQLKTYTGHTNNFEVGDSETFYVNGDTVTFAFFSDDYVDDGYYGYYATIYPIYDSEHSGADVVLTCSITGSSRGTYATTTDWNGDSWQIELNGVRYRFVNESEVVGFLEENASSILGTTVYLYRSVEASFDRAFANAGKTKLNNYYKIQDLDNNICQTVDIDQTSTVIDIRDNNTYMIGKLRDGNCWMLENLRLDPTNSTTAGNMNASNTNAPAAAINNYFNGGNVDNVPGWTNVAVVNNAGVKYDEPVLYNGYVNDLVTTYGPAASNGQAKTGVFYNYCAVSVGTYCYTDGGHLDVPETLVDSSYDVCSVNWRLPSMGEYVDVSDQYDNTVSMDSEVDFRYNFSATLAGYVDPHFMIGGVGEEWFVWTSTYYDHGYNSMYAPYITDYQLNLTSGSGFYEGISARCIVKP